MVGYIHCAAIVLTTLTNILIKIAQRKKTYKSFGGKDWPLRGVISTEPQFRPTYSSLNLKLHVEKHCF